MEQKMERKKRDKGRKLYGERAAAILFIGMLMFFCVLNLAVPDREFSARENRMLEQKPEFTASGLESGRFMDQYESYQADQFAGRDLWVSFKTGVSLLLGKREANGVFKGKGHYLLEDIARPDERQLADNLEAMNTFASKYPKISYYMMLVPNAASILSDKLPAFAVTEKQSAQFKGIRETLEGNMTWVDAWEALSEHKDEDIYYHTDHHWTTLGAYYGFQKLAASMGLDTAKAAGLKPYAVTGDFNGTLAASSGYEGRYREPIYIYASENAADDVKVAVNYTEEQRKTATLYDRSKLEERDKYAVFLGGNFGMTDIRTTADATDRLLLIKDSYANCMVPFLTPYFREIIIIDPRYYYGDIDKLMNENRITDVLFLYNGNTFAEDNSISGVLTDGEAE